MRILCIAHTDSNEASIEAIMSLDNNLKLNY